MEEIVFWQIIFLFLSGLTIIAVIMFHLRKYEHNLYDDDLLRDLNKEKEENLEMIKIGDKKINKLEKEIRKCKKILGFELND